MPSILAGIAKGYFINFNFEFFIQTNLITS